MPPALALLLLVGLSVRGGWGCLQCDRSVQEALSQLRVAIVPSRFHAEQLRTRAQALLRGMEGPFFRDYALNAFVGKVGEWRRGDGAWQQRGPSRTPGWGTLWGPAAPEGEGGA